MTAVAVEAVVAVVVVAAMMKPMTLTMIEASCDVTNAAVGVGADNVDIAVDGDEAVDEAAY